MKPRSFKAVLATVVAATLAACAASEIAGVKAADSSQQSLFGFGTSLVECPTNTASTATGLITSLGGVVSAGGTSIIVPAGAVLDPTTVTVTVPASNYMEVDISVAGVDHYLFQLPVTVTVSYARCSRANIDRSFLSAWYIDTDTHALLEQMPSSDNKLTRTVTFTTGHLSGYALAN
jgi:hypothetical protein